MGFDPKGQLSHVMPPSTPNQFSGTYSNPQPQTIVNHNHNNWQNPTANFPFSTSGLDIPVTRDTAFSAGTFQQSIPLEVAPSYPQPFQQSFFFGQSNLGSDQIFFPGATSIGSFDTSSVSDNSLWQMGSDANSESEFSSISSTQSASGFFSKNLDLLATPIPRKRRHPNSSDNGIKRKKAKFQPKKATAQLTRALLSYPKFSKSFIEQAGTKLAELQQLIDNEIERDNRDDSSSYITSSQFDSQESPSVSAIADSGFASETESVNSFTPRQQDYEQNDFMSVDNPSLPMATAPPQLQCSHPDCRFICHSQKALDKHESFPVKRYQCTFPGCHKSSNSAGDWKRHEGQEKHWPQERFMCSECINPAVDQQGNPMCVYCETTFTVTMDPKAHYLQCASAIRGALSYGRADHLQDHLQKIHGLADPNEDAKTWSFPVQSAWPRECGFCGVFFGSWNQRMAHIENHYKKGCMSSSWKLPFPRPRDLHLPGFGPNFKRDDDGDDDSDFDDSNHPPSGKFVGNFMNVQNPSGYSSQSQMYSSQYIPAYTTWSHSPVAGDSSVDTSIELPKDTDTPVKQSPTYHRHDIRSATVNLEGDGPQARPIDILLRSSKICHDIQSRDNFGKSPLHIAAAVGASLPLQRYLNDTEDPMCRLVHSPALISNLAPAANTSTTQESSPLIPRAGHEADKPSKLQPRDTKRYRRKESHNMMERKRRDNINERFQGLSNLVSQQDEKVHKALQDKSSLSNKKGDIIPGALSLQGSLDWRDKCMETSSRALGLKNDLLNILTGRDHVSRYNYPSKTSTV
jgi:hypothetical protein